ncbi:Uncharacterized protein TCM_000659 [Theobroma cacao]|uniref:Uncharacterized protein n=1 Tax=Theobroma cacao TaxID=3641 RepID=A0A061DNC8_THECC|nr:Uncharacterized protein TCM_000659 [Theobroma cacao]
MMSHQPRMIDGATDTYTICKICYLYSKYRVSNTVIVLEAIQWEKRVNNRRNINRLDDVGNRYSISGSVDKQSSGIVAVNRKGNGVIFYVQLLPGDLPGVESSPECARGRSLSGGLGCLQFPSLAEV